MLEKIPADVCETCNFLINFPEKYYFQFFVVLTTKYAVLLCYNLQDKKPKCNIWRPCEKWIPYPVPLVLTNCMIKTLFLVKIVNLFKWAILNEARSFSEAFLKHLIETFLVENIILWCCKVLHPDSPTSNSSMRGNINTWKEVDYFISECLRTKGWMEPILSWGHKGGVVPIKWW